MIDDCSDNSAKYDRIKAQSFSNTQSFSNAVRHNTKGKTMKFANIGGDMPKKPPTKPTPASAKKPAKKKC